MTIRRRIAAGLGPFGLMLGCSSPPAPVAAERASTGATAPLHPPAPADEATTTTGATTAATAPASTTVTIGGIPAPTRSGTTTTTFVMPEAATEDSDEEWGDRERILACIRSYEGDYATNTGNSHYGAYQFRQGTWDGAVAAAGYPQWVGRRASDAPAHVQDDAAWVLYLSESFGPWPPASRYCRGVGDG